MIPALEYLRLMLLRQFWLMHNCLMVLTVILVTTAVMNQAIKDY